MFHDRKKLNLKDDKVINITHEYDYCSSSRLAVQILPKLKPCVDEYLQTFSVLNLRKFLLHDIKLKIIPAGGGFHNWHYEDGSLESSARQFVVQVYLNDSLNALCLSLHLHYTLKDSPHPHLSVSFGFLKTKFEENSSFL